MSMGQEIAIREILDELVNKSVSKYSKKKW
jgi:hypothetical protein